MNEHSQALPDSMSLDAAVPSKSKYLSKEDCNPPILVQIAYMTMDDVEGDHGTEKRAVLHFNGDFKPLILNNTNKELLKAVTGAATLGELRGQSIVLYEDPTIMFGKKRVGGVRIRAPRNQPAPQVREPGMDDDLGY